MLQEVQKQWLNLQSCKSAKVFGISNCIFFVWVSIDDKNSKLKFVIKFVLFSTSTSFTYSFNNAWLLQWIHWTLLIIHDTLGNDHIKRRNLFLNSKKVLQSFRVVHFASVFFFKFTDLVLTQSQKLA